MKKLLLLALTATMFLACTKENDSSGSRDGAYLALKFPGLPSTKGNTAETGTENESKMGTATVLLFDASNTCLGVVDFTNPMDTPATESKEVSSQTAKIFVVVNNYASGWDLSSVTGKSWDEINKVATVSASNIATNKAFMMTSSGDNVKGALQDVTVYDTPDKAKQNPAVVYVDRLCSKIQVGLSPDLGTNSPGFEFSGWALNTVNRATLLYSDRITYDNASTSVVNAIYRRDNNYLKAGNDLIDIKTTYHWLSNGTNTVTMSPVDRPTTIPDYCTENTMEASAQLWGHTTKVVVKGKYTPTGLTRGEHYFSWNSNYYNITQLKQEYKKVGKENLKNDLVEFLIKAFDPGTVYGDLSPDDKKVEANIDAAITALNPYSGIKARFLAVKYYHLSVCYYDALISHDNAVTTPMALGRYGVVRNNSYLININSVKGPGTPWIPDPTDPDDPTDPTDPDDDVDPNISIQVIVKDWTYWSHNVDLGK